jgi:hypothetical protein
MKKILILSSALFFYNLILNAQSLRSSIYLYGGVSSPVLQRVTPEFGIGYIKNLKNGDRHNLQGNLGFNTYAMQTKLKYAYDFKLKQNNRFTMYVSPFVQGNLLFPKFSTLWIATKEIKIGVQPSVEFRISKNVQLIAAVPINIWGIENYPSPQFSRKININNSLSSQFNLGVRINLFNKKKK